MEKTSVQETETREAPGGAGGVFTSNQPQLVEKKIRRLVRDLNDVFKQHDIPVSLSIYVDPRDKNRLVIIVSKLKYRDAGWVMDEIENIPIYIDER